jgi:putative restriction endonuclease
MIMLFSAGSAASHIKLRRLCSTAQERLDGSNGLLLTPGADYMFDRGYISFEDDGQVRISRRVSRHDLLRLGFDQLVQERFGLAEPRSAACPREATSLRI